MSQTSQPISPSLRSPTPTSTPPMATPSSLSSTNPQPSQITPHFLSINEIIYGTSYPITVNGINVGTFTITGGAGQYDQSNTNTLTIDLDAGVDLAGQSFTLFNTPTEEAFQSINLTGLSSCLTFEEKVTTEGAAQAFKIVFAGTTCALATKPAIPFFPTMALRV